MVAISGSVFFTQIKPCKITIFVEAKGQKISKAFFLKLHCPKTNEVLDKIMSYEARAELFKYFFHFGGNGVSRKNPFEIY